jgi:hypothetical protein
MRRRIILLKSCLTLSMLPTLLHERPFPSLLFLWRFRKSMKGFSKDLYREKGDFEKRWNSDQDIFWNVVMTHSGRLVLLLLCWNCISPIKKIAVFIDYWIIPWEKVFLEADSCTTNQEIILLWSRMFIIILMRTSNWTLFWAK